MKFYLDDYSYLDKSVHINGPLDIYVDYDDVDHKLVDILLPHIVEGLNKKRKLFALLEEQHYAAQSRIAELEEEVEILKFEAKKD